MCLCTCMCTLRMCICMEGRRRGAVRHAEEVAPGRHAEVAPGRHAEVTPGRHAEEVAPVRHAEVAPVRHAEVAPVRHAEVAPGRHAEVAPSRHAEEVAPGSMCILPPICPSHPGPQEATWGYDTYKCCLLCWVSRDFCSSQALWSSKLTTTGEGWRAWLGRTEVLRTQRYEQ